MQPPSFSLPKFLVPVLSLQTVNKFSIQNSCKFDEEVSSIANADQFYMASFDVENRFTNVPLKKSQYMLELRVY